MLSYPGIYTKNCWWGRMDSNHRAFYRTDLQSAAFGHSATSPLNREIQWFYCTELQLY